MKKSSFKFDSKAMRYLLIGGIGLLATVFLAVVIFGLSLLGKKSQDMVDLKAQSQTVQTKLSNLIETKKEIQKYSYFKSVASTVIPNDKNQAAAVLEINKIASQAGILIQSITFPASTLGQGAASTDTGTPSSASALSQAKPVIGIPGLYSLQLVITPDTSNAVPPGLQVTYSKMLDFLNLIEKNRRTAQITQVSITPPGTSSQRSFSFSLTVNIFIKP